MLPSTSKLLDLAYAHASPAQKLDLYWPDAAPGPFPVILSIHGGAFKFGDKGDAQVKPMLAGLARGYAVASINYRLSGEAAFPALVHDVKAAIRWLRANAAAYRLRPDKIAAWGGSAGGYLALMAGVSAGIPQLEDPQLGFPEQPCQVQAVVAWFPPTDFLTMDAELAESGFVFSAAEAHSAVQSPESLLLGAAIPEIPDRVRAANPETYLNPAAPPFFIQHGTQDSTVPHQQSVHFAAKASARLGLEKVTLELLPGARHADPRFGAPANVNKVLDFLDKYLK